MEGDLGKLIIAKGFENLPEVQLIAQSGHTGPWLKKYGPKYFGCFCNKNSLTLSFTDCAKLQPLWVSFTDGFGFFLDVITKAKKLICASISQNIEQDMLTRRLFSFGNGI